MTRTRRPLEQSSLFDLELGEGEELAAEGEDEGDPAEAETQSNESVDAAPVYSRRSARSGTVYAGFVDLVAHIGLVLLVLVGLHLLGVETGADAAPGILVLVGVFSFFYFVIPLAFWGRTPGLAAAGLEALAEDGEALSLPQAARRWLGASLTTLLLGLPWLLLFAGDRSLSDRLSRSETRIAAGDVHG